MFHSAPLDVRSRGLLKMEPLSVGIHSVSNLGGLRANQSIAVFGCGPVGLLCMAVAKALGASRIIAVDIVPSRLEFAKLYAATDAYLPVKPIEGETKPEYSRRNAQAMRDQLGITDRGPKAIDLVIDASGAEVSIQTGIYIAKAGGTFVQVRRSDDPSFLSSHRCLSFLTLGWHGTPQCDHRYRRRDHQGAQLQGIFPIWRTFSFVGLIFPY